MARFGIVSEGRTDRFVLTNILRGHQIDRPDETVVNAVQPIEDDAASTAQPPPGGWTLVFDFLRRGEYMDALQWNDYLVLQLDTDVCEERGFDVPRRSGERDLIPEELIACVVARLESLIASEPVKAAKITGCLEAASHKLRLLKRDALQKGEHKDQRAYKSESQAYRKRATLLKQGARNPSLKVFLEELTIKTTPTP